MSQNLIDQLLSESRSLHSAYELHTIDLKKWRPFIPQLTEWLSNDEKTKLSKKVKHVQEQFIGGHAILRYLLSSIINCPPQLIEFQRNKWSKPFISKIDHPQCPYFNITHDKDRVIIGISKCFEIGVDFMYVEEQRDILEVAKRFFSTSERNFLFKQKGFEQYKSFYYIFCQKEALIKAHGKGLSLGLENFSVEPDPAQPPGVMQYPPEEKLFTRAVLETPFENKESITIVCLLPPGEVKDSQA